MDGPPQPAIGELPHASDESQARVAGLDSALVAGAKPALGALLAGTVLLRIGTVSAGAGIGFYLGDHSLAVWAGVIFAAQGLSEAISAPFLARFADRLGRKRFLVGGPLIAGFGALLLVKSAHPHHFVLARIFEGIGAGAFIPTALGMVAAVSAHHAHLRAKASAAFEGANLAGYALGFALAGVVYNALHSTGFLIMAGFYGLAALTCLIFIPHVPALPVSPLSTVFRAIVRRGPIRSFLPAWMAAFALIGAVGNNAPALLKHKKGTAFDPHQLLVHHFDARVIGAVLTLWICLLLLGILLWIPVLTRIGAVKTMRRAVPGAWVMMVGIAALNHTSLAAWVIFLPVMSVGIVILAGFGPAAVTYLTECSETFAADRSALMSFYTVTLAAGGVVGALAGAAAGAVLQVDGVVLVAVALSVFSYFALGPVVAYEGRLHQAYDTD